MNVERHQHRFVSCNGGHRRVRIHALRTGRTRHQFDEKRGDASLSNLLQDFKRTKRPEKSDENLVLPIERNVELTVDIVGSVTKHLGSEVGCGEYGCAIGDNLAAFFGVKHVEITCVNSSARLDVNLE